MSKILHDAFQDALVALARSKSVESALELHPRFTDELRPLLEIVGEASRVNIDISVSADARERSRTRMLQHAAKHSLQHGVSNPFGKRFRFSSALIIAVAIVLLSSTGIWVTSAQSLPGDPFYDLKRRAEDLNLTLTTNKASKQTRQTQYRRRRVDEVLTLLELGRIQNVTFEGELRQQGNEIWDVARVQVLVDNATYLQGPFTLGDDVEVHGVTSENGSVLAAAIELRRYHLIGRVERQDGNIWVIAGRQIDVTEALMDQGIGIGALVEAEVEVSDENLHQALLITQFEFISTPTPSDPDSDASQSSQDREVQGAVVEFNGLLERMNGSTVIIDGKVFHLSAETEIDGILAPGVHLTFKAFESIDGTWIAIEIHVLESGNVGQADSSEIGQEDLENSKGPGQDKEEPESDEEGHPLEEKEPEDDE